MTHRRRQVDIPDYGPMVRRRGHKRPVPVLVARGEGEITEGPAPDNPNVTVIRVRRVSGYDSWWKRGGITDAEREAADRYAITWEYFEGARDRGVPGMPRGGRTDWHPLMTQVQASATLTDAHKALGNDAAGLLKLYVVGGLSMGEISKRRREREAETPKLVKAALAALAKHWGMD